TGELADEVRDALLWLLENRRSVGARKISGLVTNALQELIGAHRVAQRANQTNGSPALPERSPEQFMDAMHQLLERSQTLGASYVADRVMEALIWRSSSVDEPRS